MKLLKIDSEHYAFPKGIKTVEEFVEFVNNSSQKFVKMTMYSDMNCVAPYFIEEYKKAIYVNFGQVTWIEEWTARLCFASNTSADSARS